VDGDNIRRVSFAHADPERAGPYLNVDATHVSHRSEHPVHRVTRTLTSELYEAMPDDLLSTASRDPSHMEMLRSFEITSAMVVPMIVGGAATGTVTFARAQHRHPYTQSDLQLAEDLAARVAVALENARLYQESLAMQEELRRLNEAKDEFLGMVSHELRTPITTIMGASRLLSVENTTLSPDDQQDLIASIRTDSERLRRLIEDLLVLARVELGDEVLTEPVLVQWAIQGQIEVLARRHPARKVNLSLSDGLPPVLASPTYLEQVLRNLLDNAVKYSPRDSAIEITAHSTDGVLAVTVASAGDEIPEAEVARLFERFYRSRRDGARNSGAGIGLTVCRRLVEAQGGAIWAEPREGGGLRVSFSLPSCAE
jgi:two-component system sensor histidine kinase KdpD